MILLCFYQVLDDVTLTNLDVVDSEGKKAGTLLERIDHTSTSFGNSIFCRVSRVLL